MLEILRLPSRSAVFPLIEDFDPRAASWVVSDLRSKFELQQRLLARDGGYLDTSVLRASDLWKMLLRRVAPELRVVSRDFARSLVRGEAAPGFSENSLLAAMDRFAPLIFHPESDEMMAEWFAEHPDARERWGRGYELAHAALNRMRAQNVIIAKWAPAILQTSAIEDAWSLPLIVDLGPELGTAEAELFQRLSRKVDVRVLEPAPAWRDEVSAVLRAYRDIEGGAVVRAVAAAESARPKKRAVRLASQLAEVKEATATVRRWLDEGVPAPEIGVLAPEIEDYWPVLSAYLKEEGIPADKPVTVKLASFPAVNRWVAALRPRRGELTAADLELSYFSRDAGDRLRHDEFRMLFTNLYGEEDLARDERVKRAFERGPKFDERMGRDAFLEAASFFWESGEGQGPLLKIFREILQNAAAETVFPLGDWISYLESVVASKEAVAEAPAAGGVLVTNLPSASAARLRRRVFLGLSEEGLRKAERNPLPLNDVWRLAELGFHLEHPDHSALEFELRWLAGGASEEDVFLVGASTFDGSVRAPSQFWLRESEGSAGDALAEPAPTRWDLLQRRPADDWAAERSWSAPRRRALTDRLDVDLGDAPPPAVPGPLPEKISPSFVRSYGECPFTMAAGTLFRLYDLEEVDLDLARSGLGTVMHGVFQSVTDRGWIDRDDVTDAEIESVIAGEREKQGLVFAEEGWWAPFLKRQLRVVREFLRVEREWKKRHPSLRVLPGEKDWALHFDPEAGTFHREAGDGRLRLSGRIDRLESDGDGRFVVVDYKAGASGLHDHPDWLSKNDLQLLFYMWALERGAMDGVDGRAIGAFYYVYRDFSRTRGFQLEDEAGRLYPEPSRPVKRAATPRDKEELFAALEKRVAETIRDVRAGRWEPAPRDADNCQRCAWNGLCRAKHLN